MSLLDVGLNDDALNELQPTDGITPPSSTDENNPVVVISPENPDPDPDLDMTAVIEQLDGYNAKIASLEEGVSHVHDVETVVTQIMAAESISASDVEDLQRVLPDITTDVADKRTFTEAPSKTNLVEVQRYVKDKLEEKRVATMTEVKSFLETTYGDVLKVTHTEFFRSIHEVLVQLQATALQDLPKAVASKNFMATDPEHNSAADKFVNLAKLQLGRWKERTRYIDAFDPFPPYAITNGLHYALENPYFTAFCDALEAGETQSYQFLRRISSKTNERESGQSYIDVLALFSRGHLADRLEELDKYVDNCRMRMQKDLDSLNDRECEKGAVILRDLFEYSERFYAYLQVLVAVKAVAGYSTKLFDIMAKNL